MKSLIVVVVALLVVGLSGCTCQQEVERFTEDKPLAVEVTQARSYYHAQGIKERLERQGLQAYVVSATDSSEGGHWYKVLVGAQADSAQALALTETLRVRHGFDSLQVVDYRAMAPTLTEIVPDRITQEARIDRERPDVPAKVYDVITKFPRTNMFYIREMYVFTAPEQAQDRSKFAAVRDVSMDLPRGISAGRLLDLTSAFAEAIYQDNLYGDRVTLDVLKLRPDHGLAEQVPQKAGMLPLVAGRQTQLAIAEFFADLILNTGEYATESKTEISVPSFRNLAGYKTVIEPRPDYFRTYLILVDEQGEYVVFCQSTEKTEAELMELLALVGKSEGLLEYEEFYNTFFTLPSEIDSADTFVGFYIDKLGWNYAKSKDYADWAKACVGHWAAHGLFYHEKKGPWSYGIFDLLTDDKGSHLNALYAAHETPGKELIPVYGTEGFFVSVRRWKYGTLELYWHPREVNFVRGRYICMVDNTGDTWLTRDELVERAHRFQFLKGGYQPTPADTVMTTKF